MTTVTVIKPKKTFHFGDLRELWQYRELLYFFAWRDLKVRYKQTFIGIAWALFQPLVTMIVFTIFFGELANVPSDGVPYPIFVFVGLLFWQFFSDALSESSHSLVANQAIITKVYFPRLILPVAVILTKFIDFIIATVILIVLMFYYGFVPHLQGLFLLPLLLLIAFMAAAGGGIFLSALNVKYRDVRYILPFFIQILLFLTPVIYSASIAGKYSWVLAFNPMTGVIQSARAAFLGTAPINWILILDSFAATFVFLFIAVFFFKKTERFFTDII